MPGLVGIISSGATELRRQELVKMAGCMYKRDSLESGTYVDDKENVYVGWTCHRNSYADCLPIRSSSGDLTLFFAGEHYSPDEGNEKRRSKEAQCSRDKAEVLLPLLIEKGESFFSYLNGFFHGLIIDSRRREIILFNDRFGMQRLYYYEEPGVFYFASEAKSILAIRSQLRSFDLTSLGEWLSCGAVLENRSLFRGIRVLPGASCWKWRPGISQDRRVYFKPESWESQPILSSEKFYSKLRKTFIDLLPSYLKSEGKIGVSATGGLDTRMILANIGSNKQMAHCYSFNGPYRENLDVSIGRRVAHSMGLPHTTFSIKKDFFQRFDHLAKEVILSTDGNLEMSGAPNIYVNESSREISDIRLTGNYGSEVLRRHRAFRPSNSICRILQYDLAKSVKKTASTWDKCRQDHHLTFVAFKQVPWYSYNRLQAEQSVVNMRSPFMDNSLLQVVYQSPATCTQTNLLSLRLISDGNRKLGEIMTDRGVSYPKKPSWLLTRAFYEFVFKMEHYASHGMPGFFASIDKHLGPLSLEHNFLGRNKYYHFRQWFRDELSAFVCSVIFDNAALSREYLIPGEVVKAVDAHIAGLENNTFTISKLITLELINRLLFSENSIEYEDVEKNTIRANLTSL